MPPARVASLIALATAGLPAVAAGAPAPPVGVVGGDTVPGGRWPEVAAILYPSLAGDEQRCTGTLIAPTLVVTAAHCLGPGNEPDNVLIGTASLARPQDGETIAVRKYYIYPDPVDTLDVGVIVLARASSRAPRAVATGWERLAIVDGAEVALVGFGAIDVAGNEYVNELQEGHTTITDAACTRSSGCNPAARPAGELGAGGMGVDTCPGDSGGPIYVLTAKGPWLAGVTSRSYDDASLACSQGGIYTRADKLGADEVIAGWMQRKDRALARGVPAAARRLLGRSSAPRGPAPGARAWGRGRPRGPASARASSPPARSPRRAVARAARPRRAGR